MRNYFHGLKGYRSTVHIIDYYKGSSLRAFHSSRALGYIHDRMPWCPKRNFDRYIYLLFPFVLSFAQPNTWLLPLSSFEITNRTFSRTCTLSLMYTYTVLYKYTSYWLLSRRTLSHAVCRLDWASLRVSFGSRCFSILAMIRFWCSSHAS